MIEKVIIDPRLGIKKDLLPEFISITVNEFTEAATVKFREAVNKAQSTGQTVLPVIIDSYGGYVHSLFSMIDMLEASTIPVATIATGKAMSCGAVLLSCGKQGMRYASPNSTILVHQVSSGTWGKTSDIKIKVEETDRLNKRLLEILGKNTGKKAGYYEKMIKDHNHGDIYMTPEEAKKHNLINHIGIPSVTTEIKIITTLS